MSSAHDRRFPLHWPDGQSRTLAEKRKRANYKVAESRALEEMLHSLHLLGASRVQVSTNLELKRDGSPYTSQRLMGDPGCAVWFKLDEDEHVIACDKWDRLGDNYRAIWFAVESLRQLKRCGSSDIMRRAFMGFKALLAAGQSLALNWRVELGLHGANGPPTREDIEMAYRYQAKLRHPDRGGSTEDFARLTQARDMALREVG